MLTQLWADGLEHVIAYATHAFKPNECICWDDNLPCILIISQLRLYPRCTKKTLNQLQEQMLEYDFKISYRKGIDNTAANALLRNVVATPTATFIAIMSDDSEHIISAQNNDPFIQDFELMCKKVLCLVIQSVQLQ